MTLVVVAVEQTLRGGAVDHLGELPAQVHRVLDPYVETLASDRVVDMGGVTCQQHTPAAIGSRLPGHVREARDPRWGVDPVVGPPHGDHPAPEVLQGRLAGLPAVGLADDDPGPPAVLQRAHGVLTVLVTAYPPLRLLAGLGLGDQRADRRVPAGELDPSLLAYQAPAPVTPDEKARPQRLAARHPDVHAVVVLREAGHLAPTANGHFQLRHPPGKDLLEATLPKRQHVVVAGGEVADRQRDEGEPARLDRLPLREEAVGDPSLVEHLDRPRVEAPGTGAGPLVGGAALEHHDVRSREGQLGRQHHPRRTSSGDRHGVIGHRHAPSPRARNNTPISHLHLPSDTACGGRLCGTRGGLFQVPRAV